MILFIVRLILLRLEGEKKVNLYTEWDPPTTTFHVVNLASWSFFDCLDRFLFHTFMRGLMFHFVERFGTQQRTRTGCHPIPLHRPLSHFNKTVEHDVILQRHPLLRRRTPHRPAHSIVRSFFGTYCTHLLNVEDPRTQPTYY